MEALTGHAIALVASGESIWQTMIGAGEKWFGVSV